MSELGVFVVSERYWPDVGGAELAVHLIVEISGRGFKVSEITGLKNSSRRVYFWAYIIQNKLETEKS